ncbi:MAG: ABC transporter ATP-binding protein [Solobacterium sp.]|nr:ABC transporter ATP-binding protein [Solobacterium sp.]
MTAVCTLQDVEKQYGGRTVLGPLNLTIEQGTVTGIRGINGAGKSTLLSIISGSSKPTKGKRILHDVKYIGYVPQDLSLYDSMTGMENLRFWGYASGLNKAACTARSKWLLRQMNLENKGDDPVSSYSGGMKRRLHLASALMITPEILLLDEPTVGADAASVDTILSMIVHFKNMGTAVIMISHQSDELERICDRMIVLKEGKLI